MLDLTKMLNKAWEIVYRIDDETYQWGKDLLPEEARLYKQHPATRVLNFLGFPVRTMATTMHNGKLDGKLLLFNYLRNFFGIEANVSKSRMILNAVKSPVVGLWNVFLLPIRLAINVVKLGTEFIPLFLMDIMAQSAKRFSGNRGLFILFRGLQLTCALFYVIGHAITSPIAALYEAEKFGNYLGRQIGGETFAKTLSIVFFGLSAVISLGFYAVVFPLMLKLGLAGLLSSTPGVAVVSTLKTAANAGYVWATNLPTVGPWIAKGLSFLGHYIHKVLGVYANALLAMLPIASTVEFSPLLDVASFMAMAGILTSGLLSGLNYAKDKIKNWRGPQVAQPAVVPMGNPVANLAQQPQQNNSTALVTDLTTSASASPSVPAAASPSAPAAASPSAPAAASPSVPAAVSPSAPAAAVPPPEPELRHRASVDPIDANGLQTSGVGMHTPVKTCRHESHLEYVSTSPIAAVRYDLQ